MGDFQAIFDWCVGHWAFCAFVLGMVFEIPKFKLRPFTRLLGVIGKLLNKDVCAKLSQLTDDVDSMKQELNMVKEENEKQMKTIDLNDANFIRTTILDFANSLRQGRAHTHEEYDHIIELNDKYEDYVRKYDIHNGRFTQAYQYILKCYGECLETNSFLA